MNLSIFKIGTVALVAAGAFLLIGALMTMTKIGADKVGIVSVTTGSELPPGDIIAKNREKGPQAKILGPGYHFWLWPWKYDVKEMDTFTVPQGQVGIVTAQDGKPLPAGRIFAPKWEDPKAMINAEKFLDSPNGYKGMQSTILTPGTYRINRALFDLRSVPATLIKEGEVGVIVANDGGEASADEYGLVQAGEKGIWEDPLFQGVHNLHPLLSKVVRVKTTQRIYTYQKVDRTNWQTKDKSQMDTAYDDSIQVKSKDGFLFPVSLRLSVRALPENAPKLVSLLGNPDEVIHDDQEGESLEILEAKLVLPSVKSNVRDLAEKRDALDFLNNRTEVEQELLSALKPEFEHKFLVLDDVFIDAVGLDETQQGKALLETLTNKQIAQEQKTMYVQQQEAEKERKALIDAQTQSEKQADIAASLIEIQVKDNNAKARAKEAQGEADAIRIMGEANREAYAAMVQALGTDSVALIELFKIIADKNIKITPDVMVGGSQGSSGAFEALAGTILAREAKMPATASRN